MLEVGAILEGKVTGLTAFGAFVSLPDGKSGMVHISEVSRSFVKDIKEFLKVGQDVKVKVVGISDEGKISLSIRKAEEDEPARQEKFKEKPKDRPRRSDRPARANVWQGQPQKNKDAMSFEDMMAQFKQVSDEKMSDLKRTTEFRGNNRRNKN